MTNRFLDLADSYLEVERRLSVQHFQDLMRPGLVDSLSVRGALHAATAAAMQWDQSAPGIQRWLDQAVGDVGFLEHDISSAQRALDAMSQAGLLGLSNADLHSRFGAFDRTLRDARAIIEPLDALMLASASHASDAFGRQQWLQTCLPDFDSLMDLGQTVWGGSPFDDDTRDLVQELVGEQSASAFRALERATSARVRRGLYRELGGSRHVEKLPPVALHGAFTPADKTDLSVGHASEFLVVLVRYSPLTQHNRRCYELIAAFEAFLRQELNARMKLLYGEDWIHSVSSDYRSAWRRNFRTQHGREPELVGLTAVLLSYSDLGDVMALLLTFFANDVFTARELELRFQLIRAIRNSTAHHRPLLAQDVVALQTALVEAGRVLVPGAN